MGKFLKRRLGALRRQRRPARAITRWLRAGGCEWCPGVAYTNVGTSYGYGLVATRTLRRGEVLCAVPRRAAFGGGAAAAKDEGDTQRCLATRLLREKLARGAASRWAPFLATLTFAPCPWTWSADDVRELDGTELEPVVALKLQRLESEARAARDDLGVDVSDGEYGAACAVVASHANPWFGRSVVPFNCTLNYGAPGNVAFSERGDVVVGRATRTVRAGEELLQQYAESHADLVYRYGFAPDAGEELLEDDVASVTLKDVVALCGAERARAALRSQEKAALESLLRKDEAGVAAALQERDALRAKAAAPGPAPRSRPEVITRVFYGPVTTLLLAAEAVDESPWDGLEGTLTAELRRDGEGTAKLVGVALALLAGDLVGGFRKFEARLRSEGRLFEWDADTTAAGIVVAAAGWGDDGKKCDELLAIAIARGGPGKDPWPALVARAAAIADEADDGGVVEAAVAVARRALFDRAARLGPAAAAGRPASRAAGLAARLKAVERAILGHAQDALMNREFR